MILSKRRVPRRRLIASAVVLFLAGMAMLPSAFAAEPKVLVGLGDSYSSGPGNADTGSCGRSPIAFPNLAADMIGAEGKNFACSGATTDAFNTAYDGQGPQLELLRQVEAESGVDYVAFTIGGNDIGVLRGVAGLLSGTTLPGFESRIQAEVPDLTAAYKDVRSAAPNADVYVLGYPNIFPTDNSVLDACIGTNFGGRVDLANGVTAFELMNSGLKSAVDATGDSRVHFVPVETFGGHDFCSDEPWSYGLTGRGLLHPNEAGHKEMARVLASAITATSVSTETTTTSSSVSTTTTSKVEVQEIPVTTTTKPTTTTQVEVQEIPVTTTTAKPTTTTTVKPARQELAATTSTSAVPVVALVTTTSTTAPEVPVSSEAVVTPTLAYTGSSVTGQVALAFLLTGIGLTLMWFRLVQRDRMARVVVPVKVQR